MEAEEAVSDLDSSLNLSASQQVLPAAAHSSIMNTAHDAA